MADCSSILHPFQHDPGVSQQQRVMRELLDDQPKIDGRTLADLLHFFVQLAPNISFYDEQMAKSDWSVFFSGSLPFQLAAMINTAPAGIIEQYSSCTDTFRKAPSPEGLQLCFLFAFHHSIETINDWYTQVKESQLPVELTLTKLVKNKLRQPLRKLIALHNAARKHYCISTIDFSGLDEIWGLQRSDLQALDESFVSAGDADRKRLIFVQQNLTQLFDVLVESLPVIAFEAEKDLPASLLPASEQLSKKHSPHLALVFVFIKMFQQLQNNLNGFTRKHLDFFYQDVLRLAPAPAKPDHAFILFELQNQLRQHLIEKGTLLKDGKDNNKAEVLFAADDELVVNRSTIQQVKTLFLNNCQVQETSYLEGVYMAEDARMADGIDKPFKDDPPASFATVGAKDSKYTAPSANYFTSYPAGRLGFMLASPVLLLNEGKRTINITLACNLADTEENAPLTAICQSGEESGKYPSLLPAKALFNKVRQLLKKKFVYISLDLLTQAKESGISDDSITTITEAFLQTGKRQHCGKQEPELQTENTVTWGNWFTQFYQHAPVAEIAVLDLLFPGRNVLHLSFSGAKEWIKPSQVKKIKVSKLLPGGDFAIRMQVLVNDDKPAITFYDKNALLEDFNTNQPLVKFELDDKIKIKRGADLSGHPCCFEEPQGGGRQLISFYHFFRNVRLIDQTASIYGTIYTSGIHVEVCGLRNIVVQNDDSIMDVNSTVMPFGSIPKLQGDFYIGSKEVFCKNWQTISLNWVWKDKPFSLMDYYHGYEDEASGIKQDAFKEDRFRFGSSVLSERSWFDNSTERQLFKTDDNDGCSHWPFISPGCSDPNHLFNIDGWIRLDCVKYQFVNLACLDPAALDTNGNIKPGALDLTGTVFKSSSIQTAFIKPVMGVDYLDYNCLVEAPYVLTFHNVDFPGLVAKNHDTTDFDAEPYSVNAREGFLRLRLLGQDFQHSRYPFVLTRQMMALGKFPEVYVGPVYDGINPTGTSMLPVATFEELFKAIRDSYKVAASADPRAKLVFDLIRSKVTPAVVGGGPDQDVPFSEALVYKALGTVYPSVHDINDLYQMPDSDTVPVFDDVDLDKLIHYLNVGLLGPAKDKLDKIGEIKVVIPNAPYTPQLKSISLNYTATASLTDITLIHLYPFANTWKKEESRLEPTLFPSFCDEGCLFLGLEGLVPGENLSIFFQLAEASSDSESDPEKIHWHFLDTDRWRPLRTGFEILSDGTENFTASGIVKIATPENMSLQHSIMPAGLHWMMATIPKNSGAVSETLGVFTQAVRVTFTNEDANDKLRLNTPLPANSISKLQEPDAGIKSVLQPFDSFGGQQPELQQHYYTRVSELLRHKGRAIQKFDYERIALEAFPELFKVKCINHSFALNAHRYLNDVPVAPGYVILAVIPDLNVLKAGNSYEPKVPVGMLEKIAATIAVKTSPFVRFRAMNPRYEPVDFSITVKLLPGKDPHFYQQQLADDIRGFMAPWAVGEFYKLTFGQCVNRSQIIQFIETRNYVDYILEMGMRTGTDNENGCDEPFEVCPRTPRSILVAGTVDVCIADNECESWGNSSCRNLPVPINNYCRK